MVRNRQVVEGTIIPPAEPRNEAGKFASEYPTDGRELCQLWDMPAEALQGETVKVAKYLPGTQQTELVDSMPVIEYDMESIAAKFGPGRYLLKPGPGAYRGKVATLNIGEAFARTSGWRELPPIQTRQPAPSDMWLQDRMRAGTQAPMNPLDMATMIELAVSKALAVARPVQEPPRDPVQPIMSGFELALTMMEKARSVVNPVATVEKEPATVADVLMTYGGDILKTLQAGLAAIQAPPTMKPQAPQAPKVVNPEPEPQAQPNKGEIVVNLSQEEINAINPIMGLLIQFGPMLAKSLATPATPEALGTQLAGLIGPDLEESMLALDQVVKTHGPAILGVQLPELATDKAAQVVAVAARKIREEGGQE